MYVVRKLEKNDFKIGTLVYTLKVQQTLEGGGRPPRYDLTLEGNGTSLSVDELTLHGIIESLPGYQAHDAQVDPSILVSRGYRLTDGHIELVPKVVSVIRHKTLMGDREVPVDHEYAIDVFKALSDELSEITKAIG